jgi:hypothetical protein
MGEVMTGYSSKKAAALNKLAQPVQEPVAKVCHDLEGHIGWNPKLTELPPEGTELFTAAQPAPAGYAKKIEDLIQERDKWKAKAQPEQERNFCSRCGKRTADLTVIHTCTPPKENT